MAHAPRLHAYMRDGPPLDVVYSLYSNEWRVKQGRCVISRHATQAAANTARELIKKGEDYAER